MLPTVTLKEALEVLQGSEVGWLNSQVIAAAVGALGAVVGGLIAWRVSTHQTDAQMEQRSNDELWTRYWQQQREIDRLRLYVGVLLEHIDIMHLTMVQAGLKPPPRPTLPPLPPADRDAS